MRPGERQRENGLYEYRYYAATGKRNSIYHEDLAELRALEKKIQRDMDDGIQTDIDVRKISLNELFRQYMEVRKLADSTRTNYIRMWAMIGTAARVGEMAVNSIGQALKQKPGCVQFPCWRK